MGNHARAKVFFRDDYKDGQLAIAQLPITIMDREIADNAAVQRALDAARQ